MAAVEFALVLPVLILLFLGIADFGRVFYWTITLEGAVHSGAMKGVADKATTNVAARIQAAAASLPATVTVTSSTFCTCDSATQVTCESGTPPVPTVCSGYGNRRKYLSATGSVTFSTIVDWPGLPDSVALSRTSILRIE